MRHGLPQLLASLSVNLSISKPTLSILDDSTSLLRFKDSTSSYDFHLAPTSLSWEVWVCLDTRKHTLYTVMLTLDIQEEFSRDLLILYQNQ